MLQSLRPDWDRPGIADAVWKARDKGDAIEVCVAAIRGSVISNRTPAVIPLDGNHWRDTAATLVSKRVAAADKAVHCERCGIVHTQLSPCSPPAERSHGRGAELARQALREALERGQITPISFGERDEFTEAVEPSSFVADYAGPYTEETE